MLPELESLLGNETVRARLARAADEDRLHHCYLFEGPEGVGKARVARWLALRMNCDGVPRPCGACRSCRMILAGTHPDVIAVGPDPERTTVVITADQAREVVAALQLQRHSARRRFVLVDPADAMNEEAANALLKTLEEPPPGTQFVLVTSRAAALLPTIRSRSQRVRFGPVEREPLRGWLAQRGVDPVWADVAGGSPGLALRLAEGEAAARREALDALLATVGQPLPKLFLFGESLSKKNEGAAERAALVLEVLEELLRDVAVLAGGRPERMVHADRRPALEIWARGLWPDGLGRMERALAEARDRLRLNVNGRVVLEAALATLNLELSMVSGARG